MRTILMALLGAAVLLPPGPAAETATPVLIELFTSEGCSSCPPADAYVAQLVRVQPLKTVKIIALSEHVDYWNDLGWKDPFSSAEFTHRQRRYARRLESGVYTPQVVIDGKVHLVGNRRDEMVSAIHRAAQRDKAEIDVIATIAEDGSIDVRVSIGEVPQDVAGKLVLWTALAEDGLIVEVPSGENGGRDLKHDGVARRLSELGKIGAHETRESRIALDEGWKRGGLRLVAFLEDRSDGRIVGVATAAVSASEPER